MRFSIAVLTVVFCVLLVACGDDTTTATQPAPDTGPDTVEADGSGPGEDATPDLATDVADDPEPDAAPDVAEDTEPADAPEDVAEDTSEPDTDEPDAEPDVTPDAEPDALPFDGTAAYCFRDISEEDSLFGPDYDQYDLVVGEHCQGTNHQDITDIQKVVFLGDSVTQGTPSDVHPACFDNAHYYRNKLADWLILQFGLDQGDLWDYAAWRSFSCLYSGEPGKVESGDLKNCSKWGGRTDDLMGEINCDSLPAEDRDQCCLECCAGGVCPDAGGSCVLSAGTTDDDAFCGRLGQNKQIQQCVATGTSDQNTLFVFTMGGNDVAKVTQEGGNITSDTAEGQAEIAAGYPSMWALATRMINYLEESVRFLKDPARFPNGSHVVFGNPFEFTDGTGDVSACSPESISIAGFGEFDVGDLGLNVAGIAGFQEWEDVDTQADIVIWMTEQYMRIAVEYGADMIWMLEGFCGHGYVATGPDADTTNQCYREDDPTLWFDISCTHPNADGHNAIFEMFRDVIQE